MTAVRITMIKNILNYDHPVYVLPLACPHGWILFGTSCYIVREDKLNWDAASSACHSDGAVLAEVRSDYAVDFIKNILIPDPADDYNT